MPAELQREIVHYVDAQRRNGRTVSQVIAELGVRDQRLSYWRKKSEKQLPVAFRAVVVRGEAAQNGSEIVLELGANARVRGLSVAQLSEVLRALG